MSSGSCGRVTGRGRSLHVLWWAPRPEWPNVPKERAQKGPLVAQCSHGLWGSLPAADVASSGCSGLTTRGARIGPVVPDKGAALFWAWDRAQGIGRLIVFAKCLCWKKHKKQLLNTTGICRSRGYRCVLLNQIRSLKVRNPVSYLSNCSLWHKLLPTHKKSQTRIYDKGANGLQISSVHSFVTIWSAAGLYDRMLTASTANYF